MRIGELASRANVTVRALRYYEQQGLLDAVRSSGGHRHYPESAVERLAVIRQFFAAGLSSRTVAELMESVDKHHSTPEARARLVAERDRMETQIADLAAARDRLNEVIKASFDPASGCTFLPDAYQEA